MNDEEFRKKLNPEQYRIMREKGTENAHSGQYADHDEPGLYACAACGNILFTSLHKLDAEEGYPDFKKPARSKSIALLEEAGKKEVMCADCGCHLGYVESDGRYRVNSAALEFIELPELELDAPDDSADDGSSSSQASTGSGLPMKTLTLSVGGLALGVALGASAMTLATPAAPLCATSTPQTVVETSVPKTPASKPAVPAVNTVSEPVITQPSTSPEENAGSASAPTNNDVPADSMIRG